MPVRRGGRRRLPKRNRNFIAIPYSTLVTLGALLDGVVIEANTLNTNLGEDLFVVSIDALWSMLEHTAAEGPVVVGFAHSDLSVGEVAEALAAEVTDPDDIIAKERARRPVRRSGIFSGLNTDESLNQGVMQRTAMRFSVGNDFNIAAFAQNQSGATLTTGTLIRVSGTIFGRWQR